MKAPYLYSAGDQISGIYFGAKFSGIVTNARQHTMDASVTKIFITLDAPITIMPGTRIERTETEGLCLICDDSNINKWGKLL